MKSVALVGPTYGGKSTVFRAVGSLAVSDSASKANVAMLDVPEPRLDRLAEKVSAEKKTAARVKLIDAPGSSGQGMSEARAADALAVVCPAFGGADPSESWEIFRLECVEADQATVAKSLERIKKKVRSGDKLAIAEEAAYQKAGKVLEDGTWVIDHDWDETELRALQMIGLLTLRKALPVVNVDETWDGDESGFPAGAIAVRALLEAEASELDPEEAAEFMSEFGVTSSALDRFISALYELLDLISFFTGNEVDARAWEIPRGTRAPQAAGQIHRDFEKGFIRWEAVDFDDFMQFGSWDAAKQAGKLRVEGKDYVVRDGDVVRVLHS